MKDELNYKNINKALWDDKTKVHVASEFYNNQAFLAGKSTLNEIELPLLGNIEGKSVLHLQCHFGQDTLSMARMGAKTTGVDLSSVAIEKANDMAAELNINTEFICSDIYDLPNVLHKKYDIVFASYGTIGWLPSVKKWAEVVKHYLKPGGKLVFADFHPVVWMFDYDFEKVSFGYFNNGPIVEELEGTYTNEDADIKGKSVSWNHSMSDIIDALLVNGLQLEHFSEYDYSPYNCFKHLIEFETGKYRIKHLDKKLPIVYALVARNSP